VSPSIIFALPNIVLELPIFVKDNKKKIIKIKVFI